MTINSKLKELVDKFEEYLKSAEAKSHLELMKKEKKEVAELMDQLSSMDKKSKDFTNLVLYGLLPNHDTKYAKRVSLFPSFMNIRKFFDGFFKYTEDEYNIIANKIFDLAISFRDNRDNLPVAIKEFITQV
ncbi:hypothetical protein HQ545_02910 [Candidatus Woesearchaeota archaeon]|nr:hypothetical protein [Candidatus Woesearchaeota archaeon]